MPTTNLNRVVQYLRRVAVLQENATLSDAQLLGHFIENRDEGAFKTLVRRHGAMVLGVCRRILGNQHDAEDAFQATFLVLVLKAASVKPRQLLGNWLYGVAYQTAVRARSATAKRHRREKQVSAMAEPAAASQELWDDLQPLLDEELSRLPDKYRVPIVLCDLEGKTRKEAALQLGWPEGTVSGRLSRGRAMLAKRLTRHGLGLSAGGLAVALAEQSTSASVPAGLLSSTTKAAALVAAGQATAAAAVSGKVALLMKGALHAMLISKLKSTSAVVMAVGLAIGMAGIGGNMVMPGNSVPGLAQAGEQANGPASEKQIAQAKNDKEMLQGTWKAVWCERFGEKLFGDAVRALDDDVPFAMEFIHDKVKVKFGWPKINDTDRLSAKNQQALLAWELLRSRRIHPPDLRPLYQLQVAEGGRFQLDPQKTPKQINFPDLPWNQRLGMKAVYEVSGDTLKICWNHPPLKDEPPTELTGKGPNQFLVVFAKAGAEKIKQPKRDEESLIGSWIAVSAQRFGETMTDDAQKPSGTLRRLVFENESIVTVETIQREPYLATKHRRSFSLKPMSRELAADLKHNEIDFGGFLGIYELDGDTLKLCWNDPAVKNARPTEFSGTGPNRWLMVFKREKAKPIAELQESQTQPPSKQDAKVKDDQDPLKEILKSKSDAITKFKVGEVT